MQDSLSPSHRPGHQSRGQAWSPDRADILDLLGDAQEDDLQPIYYGSNYTFLATVSRQDAGSSLAIYKPARGEYPLYDFAPGTLYRREVATFLVDKLLGWGLVPPTVLWLGELGRGSLQLYIESYPRAEISLDDLRRLAILDVVLNNADRKLEHLLLGEDSRLWAIDHGLTFHAYNKLRTVLWHFAGDPIPEPECLALRTLLSALDRSTGEAAELRELLSGSEWRALIRRVENLLSLGRLPDPRHKPVPYRW